MLGHRFYNMNPQPPLAELVWDGRSRIAWEEEGHQGHAPQHICEAHIQNGRASGRGLVQPLHAHSLGLQGAVEHDVDLDVVRAYV